MKAFLGSVLTLIAAGVLLIAYGLLGPHAGAFSTYPQAQGAPLVYDAQSGVARPMLASERLTVGTDGRVYATPQYAEPAPAPQDVTYTPAARPVTVAQTVPAPRRTVTRTSSIDRGSDWKKTAMVIGGTTAAGAGLGAIFGGKKGAAIGAALGGGGATLYQVIKK